MIRRYATEAEARARLERMTAASVAPSLTAQELDDLMVVAARGDSSGYGAAGWSEAARNTAYVVGDRRVPTNRNGHVYQVIAGGTSHATADPAWPTTSRATVVDGTVTWQEVGIETWQPTYDLDAAAAEGWRWKAGRLSDRFDVAAGDERYQRSQAREACLAMADRYQKKVAGSVQIASSVRSAAC